jgi:hypothetical protein
MSKQTAVDTLIINFKGSIKYLESSLGCCNDELTNAQLKARLSQARYFLNYAIEAKEIEKQKLEQFYNHGQWAIIEHGHGESFEDYYNKTFNK